MSARRRRRGGDGPSFAGLGLLPLPEVTAIGYAAPLLVVLSSPPMFLGEQVRAVPPLRGGLGLIGVLVIVLARA